jgi:hypothetical protein
MKHSWQKISVAIFVAIAVILIVMPRHADALLGAGDEVFDPITEVETTFTSVSDTITSTIASQQWLVTNVLNPLAYAIAQQLLSQIANSIVQWANNGFQGGPAFVSDPAAFFENVGNYAAGQVIQQQLAFMCTPFKLTVALTLQSQYQATPQNQCTLTGVVGNIQNFINGSFSEGNWNGWLQMTNSPYGNPYSSVAFSSANINVSVTNAVNIQQSLLNWGQGFFSQKDPSCVANDNAVYSAEQQGNQENGGPGVAAPNYSECPTVTPGSAINTQVNQALGLPANQLQLVNSYNQVINAALYALTKAVFMGAGGLLGAGQSTSASGSNFVPSYVSDLETQDSQTASSLAAQALPQVQTDLQNEQTYNNYKTQELSAWQGAESDIDGVLDCYATGLNATSVQLLATSTIPSNATPSEVSAIEGAIGIRNNILSEENSLSIDIQNSNNFLTGLQGIITGLQNTTTLTSSDSSDGTDAQTLLTDYSSNYLGKDHSAVDSINAQTELTSSEGTISGYNIPQLLSQCQSLTTSTP